MGNQFLDSESLARIDNTAAKLLPTNWQLRLQNNSTPKACAIVFLVRKGNPKKHQG